VLTPHYAVDYGAKRRLAAAGFGGDVDPSTGLVYCLKHMDPDWFAASREEDDE